MFVNVGRLIQPQALTLLVRAAEEVAVEKPGNELVPKV